MNLISSDRFVVCGVQRLTTEDSPAQQATGVVDDEESSPGVYLQYSRYCR